jgi:hypothetical protein
MIAGLLAKLENEIVNLEEIIKSKERWVVLDEKREDLLAEEGTLEANQGGLETKKVTVLQGAEEERKLLEKLLLDRLKLTGMGGEDAQLVGELKFGSLGFGGRYAEQYSLGKGYNMQQELETGNERFNATVDVEALPTGELLMIYICNFHVLCHFLLIYISFTGERGSAVDPIGRQLGGAPTEDQKVGEEGKKQARVFWHVPLAKSI